ncbi:hypothetical protein CVT26_000770 [Gymnopilus dilepis]|uniref:Uncharacterized protein n=1 Tax=Gymnopilus dilepis TaxID=231916 RepID=A0A409Y2I1_9AGAR|nr:hypothetical protein CVT26_000770 [Gymnopilus dilepis]
MALKECYFASGPYLGTPRSCSVISTLLLYLLDSLVAGAWKSGGSSLTPRLRSRLSCTSGRAVVFAGLFSGDVIGMK